MSDAIRAALLAVKADPQACHSIAVWEQIDAALALDDDEWIQGFLAGCRLHAGDHAGWLAARGAYLRTRANAIQRAGGGDAA